MSGIWPCACVACHCDSSTSTRRDDMSYKRLAGKNFPPKKTGGFLPSSSLIHQEQPVLLYSIGGSQQVNNCQCSRLVSVHLLEITFKIYNLILIRYSQTHARSQNKSIPILIFAVCNATKAGSAPANHS